MTQGHEQSEPNSDSQFHRPDHPDFERLRLIIAVGLDRHAAEDPGFNLEEYLGQSIDAQSLSYWSLQRALRAFSIESPAAMVEQMESLMRVCAIYLEAFIVGVQWERANPNADPVLAGVARRMITEFLDVEMVGETLHVTGALDLSEDERRAMVALDVKER